MSNAAAGQTSILDLVNKTLELPTLPQVLVKLNEVIAREDACADDVADVIVTDPAVATNILRIVNSAYYGLQVRVSSVSLAVSILGFNATKKAALTAAVFATFGGKRKKRIDVPQFDPVAFWQHANFTGVAARVVGERCDRFDKMQPEDLYICGLLHDIGKIILLEKAPDEYAAVLAEAEQKNRPELEIEKERLGFTHADVGSVLAIKWFLPEDLTIAIRYHHAPEKDPFDHSLSSLIHLADHLAWSAGKPSTKGITSPNFRHEVFDDVELDPQDVDRLLPTIEEKYKEMGLPF